MATQSKILITGGAGFIGSHLVDSFMQAGDFVRVLDNFSNGSLKNIERWIAHEYFELIEGDLKDFEAVKRAVEGTDVVVHAAANPEVRVGETNPQIHFDENILSTHNLLKAIIGMQTKIVIFLSTSTVYGEAEEIPTSEQATTNPISTYGATKLACEALMHAYTFTYNHRGLILRLANIIGPRSNHGVIIDFLKKLRSDPTHLEILGDGTQNKSYLYVLDCISAFETVFNTFRKQSKRIDTYNIGSQDQVTVKRISVIVAEELNLTDLKFTYTGGVDGGRGWKGDVKNMLLSIEKLKATGWRPRFTSEQAVRETVRQIVNGD